MPKPETIRDFLIADAEALTPFDFVVVAPVGHPYHVVELTKLEDGGLELRIPGRPPMVPKLDTVVCGRLRDRGFVSEDPDDSMKPWVRPVDDVASAVALLQEVGVEVFGEKPDAPVDVAHGSHRTEHEAQQKLQHARSRIETIVSDVLQRPAEQDADGDYALSIGEVHVTVAPRMTPQGQIVIRVFAITNVGVIVTGDLGLFLARLNFGLMFGRFALDAEHRSIWFDETLLGEEFREEELRFAIDMIASTADSWDDRLKQMFGGATYQEILMGRSGEAPPPTKPGEGVGMYL